jgi:hypothetical protein
MANLRAFGGKKDILGVVQIGSGFVSGGGRRFTCEASTRGIAIEREPRIGNCLNLLS